MKCITLALLLSAIVFSCTSPRLSTTSGIRNTHDFITYFTGIENMVTYGKQKDSLEKMAKEIQVSKSLSEQQRVILKSYYNDVQQKSEMLYLKLTNDLLNSDKRKQIRNDIAGYVQSINGDFQAIKTSGEAFSGKYKEITGATRGVFVAWLIKSFALPLLESFVREIISEVARQQLDRHLKPLVVVKPWDSI